jgi:hypothetical protein
MKEIPSSARPQLDSRSERLLRWAMRLVERLGPYWTSLIITTPVWVVTNIVVEIGNSTGSTLTLGTAGRRNFD